MTQLCESGIVTDLQKAICEVDQRLLLPFVAWHLCREGVNNFPGILGSPPQLICLCSSQNLRTQRMFLFMS